MAASEARKHGTTADVPKIETEPKKDNKLEVIQGFSSHHSIFAHRGEIF